MSKVLSRLSPILLSILRMVAGVLFVQHGFAKLFGWFGGTVVPTYSLLWTAGVLESIAGPLIILGLFTRPVAFVLSGEMLVAYWLGHHSMGGWPVRNGGVVPLLFCLIFFHLATVGGGALALDSLRSKSSVEDWINKLAPLTLGVARIGAAFLFWQFGTGKILGWFGVRRVSLGSRLWIAGIMETIGGPFLALGLFTRPLAFLFSGEMAVAFWTSHVPRGPTFWPIQNGGEPAVLFCFFYLYLVTAGPGWLSLDGILFKKSAGR
jgi:putative oxidoreductase